MRRVGEGLAAWLLVGAIGWAGIIAIGWMLWQATPPKAGFDLVLLLDAARRVSAGASPYDPAMLAGSAPAATALFYSYPPVVAQAMVPLGWLPNGMVLLLWGIGATLGLGVVARGFARQSGRMATALRDAVRAMALASLILPFAVAVLFGNLDAWYVLAFGLLVLACASGPPSRNGAVAAGIALGVISVAKLHPASLVLWLAARLAVNRQGPERVVLTATVATVAALVGFSLLLGGLAPWSDYLTVLRAGSGADLVDPRNAGPVSIIGQLIPLDSASLRLAQVVVTLSALALTLLAAIRVREPVASLAMAITASLVVLPVTWYHYPVALIPVGMALIMRAPATRLRVVLAAVVGDLAIGGLPLIWLSTGVLVAAARRANQVQSR